MLEGLDEINWSQLHHAYGEANNVPQLIRKLLSKNEQERNEAISDLFQIVWHQGTVYEASSYAVPFLYELLKSPETPDKLSIAFLLANLATGRNGLYKRLDDEKEKARLQRIYEEDGRILEEEVKKQQSFEDNVRNAIRKEFNLIYPYLFCKEPSVIDDIAEMFGEYPEFKDDTLPLLKKALNIDSDEFARKTIENSIKILSGIQQ